MNNVMLMDVDGNKYKVDILFTYFDYDFGKNYIVYLIDDDLLAASYEEIDNKYIINSDLTTNEYDMIDKTIQLKMGEAYA